MPFCLGYARTVPVKAFANHLLRLSRLRDTHGRTTLLGDATESPVAVLDDGRTDGYYLDNTCWGSYMHGILDNPEVLDNLAEGFDKETTDHPFDYAAFKEEQYDKLANLVRKHVDMDYIYRQLV